MEIYVYNMGIGIKIIDKYATFFPKISFHGTYLSGTKIVDKT